MAAVTTVRINKGDSPNLGFRLQGGKDFGTPLVVQKVNVGSPAERAGLVAGDSVIKINNTDVFNLRHKDAQDVVVRAGPSFDITVQRGGSTWKPSVVPTGSYPTPSPVINNISPVTRTSLAANKTENIGAIGTGHNVAAKPFAPQVNGAVNGPKLVNKQYNSPLKLYSEESIAETLSAQTEVLSTGVLGVNFKKNEKNYDASNSAVLRALKESENEPKISEEEPEAGVVTSPNSGIAGLRHVKAPENRPAPANPQLPPVVRSDFYSTQSHAIGGRKTVTPNFNTPPDDYGRSNSVQGDAHRPNNPSEGATVCTDCERVIVGVFVRIKDKNLHVECFKCATCGTSLKNVGYYNINNKLYCDIHAKSAAIRSNANPNLVPVTVSPGGKAPVHAISSALASHSLPSPSPLSPKINSNLASPYQPQETKEIADVSAPLTNLPISNVATEANNNISLCNNHTPLSYSKYLNKSPSSFSGPKPFSSVSAPLSPRAAPLSPVAPVPAPSFTAPAYKAPSYSPASSTGRFSSVKPAGGLFKERSAQSIIWPPPHEEPEIPTACPLFYPPPSQVEQRILSRRAEREAELESVRSDCEEVETITAMAQFNPKMSLCSEEVMNLTERRSCTECVETISETLETQRLVEDIVKTRPRSPPPIDDDIRPPNLPKLAPTVELPRQCPKLQTETICCQRRDSSELRRPTQFTPNTIECQLPSKIDNAVPQKWESPLTQALRTTAPDPDTFAQIPTKHSSSALASALAIAPCRPFTPSFADDGKPVPLPEETVPYFPPERPVIPPEPKAEPKPKPERPKSQFVKALETAPERPFTPVGGLPPLKKKPKDPTDEFFKELPRPHEKLSMLEALTTAPERPYSPLIVESVGMEVCKASTETQQTKSIDRSQLYKPLKPDVLPASFQMNKKEPKPPSYYSPSVLYQRTTEEKTEEHTEESDTSQTRTIERQTIHNPQTAQVIVENEDESPHHFAPVFQAVSCFYQNKKNNFSVEISTSPVILTPPPKAPTPAVKIIESKPGYIEKETITEEKRAHQQKKTKEQRVVEEERGVIQATAKQAEEVIQKKARPPVMLHKPEGLPSYQVQLSENAEADLLLMEKMEKAQSRLEQQKVMRSQQSHQQEIQRKQIEQQQIVEQRKQQLGEEQRQQRIVEQQRQTAQQQQVRFQEEISKQQAYQCQYQQRAGSQHVDTLKKPIITIQPDESVPGTPQTTFQPVIEDRPPSTTFSPRPGALTPSMINRPAPVLPYYQENLVSHFMTPPTINVLDPTSPSVSRSPSPRPGGRSRSPSPFPSAAGRGERAVSPAAGPPPNPLKSSKPLPTPRDSKIAQARDNISTYIPEYKSKRDLIEKVQGVGCYTKSEETQQSQIHQTQAQQCQIRQSCMQQSRAQQNQTLQSHDQRAQVQQRQALKTQALSQQPQMYVSRVQAQSFPTQQSTSQYERIVSEKRDAQTQQQVCESQKMEIQEASKADRYVEQTADGMVSTAVSEQRQEAHLDQMRKSQCQSIEKSADGRIQVQRKKMVTEEYEQTHKECNVQIEKTLTSTKKYPFHDINAPVIEGPGVLTVHFTNPQPLSSSSRTSGQVLQQAQKCTSTDQITKETQQSSAQASSDCSTKTSTQQCCLKASQQTAQSSAKSELSQATPTPIKHVYAPGSLAPIRHVDPPGSTRKPNQDVIRPNVSQPNAGAAGGRQAGGISVAPKRGRGVLNAASLAGSRIALCGSCNMQIRGPFITALGKIWCPNHFVCSTPTCRRPLQDLGFVEEHGQLYCEFCFEQYIAPPCSKCGAKIKGDCLKAIGKNFHPECFNCVYCGKLFGNSPFFLEDGNPYCDADWNELFTTKCYACGFPVEAGDRWVEALNNNYHSQCFNCTMCKKNLEGQSFFAKGGRPFCKNHAR